MIGDRIDGGLLSGSDLEAPLDLGVGDPIMVEISNQGLQSLGDELTMKSAEIIESFGGIETVQDFGMGPYVITGAFEDTPLVAVFDTVTMPTDSETGDSVPMRLGFEVKNTVVSAKLRGEEISIAAQPASIGFSISRQILSAFGYPVANSSGVHVDGLEFFLEVTPLMEHTVFGTIRSSARMEIHLPSSVRLLSFESREGLGELIEQDGRQVVVYRTPTCPEATSWSECSKNNDIVSYSLEVSWMFVIGELAPYIFMLIFAIGMLISRRRRRKIEHKQKKAEEASAEEQEITERAMESEFGKLDDGATIVDESFFE